MTNPVPNGEDQTVLSRRLVRYGLIWGIWTVVALFFTDLYLTASEETFSLREIHRKGGDERGDGLSPGVPRAELLPYVQLCRAKAIEVVANETEQSLAGPSGFSWRKCSRLELHIYNIRHVQHHTGQLSAYLRRVDPQIGQRRDVLKWIGWGWRSA